ncbi:hypothetical protein D0T53_12080 [Dysgonomonas sp. 216]|uniref:DUF3329 domain-containing protein n=1 Tax=Dysgonomonas sp. 216 TaxID=2302934 RepID=UPI0013D5912B|nr:DUF6056 family protein [Dysgonomonas sp. 216]NDW19645.1 hypothetical protein [Dysgonomonas sp. 216]
MNKNTNLPETKSSIQSKISFVLVLLLLFCLSYALNLLYPLIADDWVYAFTWSGGSINSFADIIASQYHHYFEWGGRSVAHTIVQSLLWFGKGWSNILNTIIYTSLIIVIYKLSAKEKNEHNITLLLFIFLFMWFFQSEYGETTLWVTGSGNYMWSCFIILLFLVPYCNYYRKGCKLNNKYLNALLPFAGLIAGWTNENMSLATLFFLFVLFFLIKADKRKIPLWAILGCTGFIIGMVFLFAAPGNYVRLEEIGDYGKGGFLYFLSTSAQVLKKYLRYGLLPSVIFCILLSFVYKTNKKEAKSLQIKLALLFFASAQIAVIVMIGSPKFPPRAWFGIITFIILASAMLYSKINFSNIYLKNTKRVALILGLLFFGITYVMSVNELKKTHELFQTWETCINEQKNKGIEDVILYGKYERKKNPLIIVPKMRDFPSEIDDWRCECYRKYKGVKSITIIKDSAVIYKGSEE